jgi:hypothetical protein
LNDFAPPRQLHRYAVSLSPNMKEISTPEFEQFLQHLRYYDENSLGNLSPFFDAKLLEMESPTSPASIITSAYPGAKVDKAEISEHSTDEIETAINKFFSPFTNAGGRTSSVMANEFLNGLRSCVDLDNSKAWEYFPDWQSSDELYDYIAAGFTYIIADRDEARCLIVHGGYMD